MKEMPPFQLRFTSQQAGASWELRKDYKLRSCAQSNKVYLCAMYKVVTLLNSSLLSHQKNHVGTNPSNPMKCSQYYYYFYFHLFNSEMSCQAI